MSEVRLIDANALIREMCTKFYTTPYYKYILDVIDNAPTVTIDNKYDEVILAHERISYERGVNDGYAKAIEENERPKGEWIKEPNGRTTDIYRCSLCKRSIMLCKGADLTNYPFCHCGAKMINEETPTLET